MSERERECPTCAATFLWRPSTRICPACGDVLPAVGEWSEDLPIVKGAIEVPELPGLSEFLYLVGPPKPKIPTRGR